MNNKEMKEALNYAVALAGGSVESISENGRVIKSGEEITSDVLLDEIFHELKRLQDLLEYEETRPETWLDRIKAAWPGVVNTYDVTGGPIVCLGELLGYEGCLHSGEDYCSCLECWDVPVKELGLFEAEEERE